MTKRKPKEIKAKEIQLSKDAIKRLVKVTDTPKAWAMFDRLWTLSEQAVAVLDRNGNAASPPKA